MEPTEAAPAVAERLFGDRMDIAREYHEALATDGVEWGLVGHVRSPACGTDTFSTVQSSAN